MILHGSLRLVHGVDARRVCLDDEISAVVEGKIVDTLLERAVAAIDVALISFFGRHLRATAFPLVPHAGTEIVLALLASRERAQDGRIPATIINHDDIHKLAFHRRFLRHAAKNAALFFLAGILYPAGTEDVGIGREIGKEARKAQEIVISGGWIPDSPFLF